jgi:hypothetical protein
MKVDLDLARVFSTRRQRHREPSIVHEELERRACEPDRIDCEIATVKLRFLRVR